MNSQSTSRRLLALLVALPLAIAACDDDEEAKDVTPFVGTWYATSGTLTPTCPAPFNMLGALPLQGPVVVEKSTTGGDLSVTILGCKTNFTVTNATTATIVAGQSCPTSLPVPNLGNIPVTLQPATGTLTLVGANATFSGNGAANAMALGTTIMCTYTLTASLGKTAPVNPDGGAVDASPRLDSAVAMDAKPNTDTAPTDSGADATKNDAAADAARD